MSESMVWSEKYRPKKLAEVINQRHVTERIKAFVDGRNLPHMIFAGSPGTGKTTLALVIAQELYGDSWKQHVLELNASNDRGIEIVRGKIKEFSRIKPMGEIPWNMIILDEADALTTEAQHALRRTMEVFANTSRFVLICVSPDSKIVLPEEIEMTIGSLSELNHDVLSVDTSDNLVKSDKVLGFIEIEPKKLNKKSFVVATNTGRELKLTEDHPVLTSCGWRRACDLETGDKVAVFPHLEGTGLENNCHTFVGKDDFSDFVEKYEINFQDKTPVGEAKSFGELTTRGKIAIKEFVLGLYNRFIATDKGLTKKEHKLLGFVQEHPHVSRKELQDKMGLSRIRTDELLRSLEKRGCIKRIVDGKDAKVHYFVVMESRPAVRNRMDIKNIIKDRFDLSVSYTEIKRMLENKPVDSTLDYVIKELESKNLMPLAYDNAKMGAVSRIAGALFGDGHLTKSPGTLIFTSNDDMLREIQNDIYRLGFVPGNIRKNKILNKDFKGRSISGTTTEFRVNSMSLWLLFSFLGVPVGDKGESSYCVPSWVMRGTRFVKREFLRAFLDCESTTPVAKRHYFGAICAVQHKEEDNLASGKLFMEQLAELLKEFSVESFPIGVSDTGLIRKSGKRVYCVKLTMKSYNENALNFFRHVGFFYETKKRMLSRIAQEYLRYKSHIIDKRLKVGQQVLVAVGNGKTAHEASKEFGCTSDFVYDRLEGKEVKTSYKNLLSFNEWKEAFWIKGSELVWNVIERIDEISLDKAVDITTQNLHTFISNGFVSHNCNYSNKIIEPIQSRCAVFRFRSLSEADIKKYVERIVEGEKLKITEGAINAVIEISEGDLRKVTNLLQTSAALGEKITEDEVYGIASRARPTDVKDMLHLSVEGKFKQAREKLFDLLLKQGLSGGDIVAEIHRQIYSLEVDEKDKVKLLDRCGECDFRLTQGANELIQIEALLAQFMLLQNSK